MTETETQPFLRAGWEPDTPDDDTILRAFLCNWAAAAAASAGVNGGRILLRGDLAAVDRGCPAGFDNRAVLFQPLASTNQDEVLDAMDAFYRFGSGHKTGDVLLFSAWPTPDLRSRGWRLEGHPPLHLLPPGRAQPPLPNGLRIERVADEAALRLWEETAVDAFPLPELRPFLPGGLVEADFLADTRSRFWLGWYGDRPVTVSSAFVANGLIDVTFVATRPEARGRGFGAAMAWSASLAEPGRPALLLSTDDGRPVYDRMGFVPLFRFTVWSRSRPHRG